MFGSFYYIQEHPHLQQVYDPVRGPLNKNNIKISGIILFYSLDVSTCDT